MRHNPTSSRISLRSALALSAALCLAFSTVSATAQQRSTLVDTTDEASGARPTPTAPRSLPSRAPVTDARLFNDMTIILPSDMRSPAETPAPSTTRSAETTRNAEQPRTPAQAPIAIPSQFDRPAPTATTDEEAPSLFASATITQPTERTTRTVSRAPSEAYVPMLPEDFYAPTNVQRDPVAAEVGLPDMEPMGADGAGFRYLQRRPLEVSQTRPGIVAPYPVSNVFSTYGDCRPGGRTHAGLDLGGVGANGGIGTPLYAMSRSRVTFIGRPEEDPEKFGQPDMGNGHVQRGPRAAQLPRSMEVPGYGVVRFFTRTYGSWRSGAIIVMEGLEGPLKGHRIRYMHLGAIHPELRVGDIVEGGQEVGLMGGTAVQHDMPHVHIDIEDAKSRRVDVAPLIGLPGDNGRCRR